MVGRLPPQEHDSDSNSMSQSFPFLTPDDRPGSLGRLQEFRITKLIGEGGMGYVFHAVDQQLQRPVALKVLKTGAAAATGQARFLREARALALVSHPNVVTIHQVGIEKEFPFLVMELLKGQTLAQRIRDEQSLTITETVRCARQLLSGLVAVHDAGVVHRDIKPSNLWLQHPSDAVQLLDFGLVRQRESELTQVGALLGTPQYISPEQARGEPIDHRSDLYSVGVVIYEMLTGHPPHRENNAARQLAAVVAKCPKPLSEFRSDVPDALGVLVESLLQKQPGQRPKTASETLTRLDSVGIEETVPRVVIRSVDRNTNRSDRSVAKANRTKSALQSTKHALARPIVWMATAICVFTSVVVYASRERLFPATPIGQVTAANATASPRSSSQAKRAPIRSEDLELRRYVNTIAITTGVDPDNLYSVSNEGQDAPNGSFVNLAHQPTLVRQIPVLRFDLPRDSLDQCVDVMLSLTLKGGNSSSEVREANVFACDGLSVPAEDLTLAKLDELVDQGDAVELGEWTFDNTGYRNNGKVDAIRFTSSRLIQLIRKSDFSELVLWIKRTDQSNGQTHFCASQSDPERLPKLWFRTASLIPKETESE